MGSINDNLLLGGFPRTVKINDKPYRIRTKKHYKYLNKLADQLYRNVHGYISRPDFDYYYSRHPQEHGCFCSALILDRWWKRNSVDSVHFKMEKPRRQQ